MKNKVLFIFLLVGILFVLPALSAQEKGDVNHDYKTDIIDALLTAQYYVGINSERFYSHEADVDCSGKIDIIDALLIAQYYVGFIAEFDCSTQTNPDDQEPFISKDSNKVFSPQAMETYSLTMTDADWQILNDNAKNTIEEYVPASLKAGSYEIGKVGIRYKGNYTLWGCFDSQGNRICDKLSLKIKFDKYDDDKRYYGLKRLNFHSMLHDPSLMKERLAYSIFREMGIFTSRVTHAKLYINNQFLGIFTLVEQIDGRFTDLWFPGNGDGNLYKATWPDSNNPWYYDWGLKTNEDVAPPEENNKKICQFYNELSTPASIDEQIQIVEKWWYVDELMKYFVINDAITNWDGPTAYWCGDWNNTGEIECGNGNFYIYQEEKADKFHLLAWDLTTVFDTSSPFQEIGVPLWYDEPTDCSADHLYSYSDSNDDSSSEVKYVGTPNCDLFFQTLAAIKKHSGKYKGLYDDYMVKLLNGPFKLSSLFEKIDAWAKQIADDVPLDTNGPGFEAWQDGIVNLKNNLVILNQKQWDLLNIE